MGADAGPGDRFDGLFMTVAQQAGGIENIFESYFGFLYRKTDFFVGTDDKAKAFHVAQKTFDKYWEQAQEKKKADKKRLADLDAEKKKRADINYHTILKVLTRKALKSYR